MEKKKINQMSLANCDLDEVEIVLGDRFELKIIDGKYYAVRKKPTYPKIYEEDNYCETLEIKVLGYKVGDVVFTNHAGWIKITNKLWDCYAKEHVYEGIGVLNKQEYDNISHKDIINKMETDSVIENMKESITPSPHITANITEKNNCDIECPDMLDADKNLFHTTNEYEEIVDKSFQGGYEKCKLDIQLNGYELPDGYHFTDENGNVIDATKILIKKNTPTYPKTYEACWKVFGLKHNLSLWWNAYDAHSGIVSKLPKELLGIKERIESLSKLLVCRNVYWKLYGEEIGLDGSWEPDWNDNNQPKFGIHNVQNDIRNINLRVLKNLILVFPTEEMRDTFFENFKDLIEDCKELL